MAKDVRDLTREGLSRYVSAVRLWLFKVGATDLIVELDDLFKRYCAGIEEDRQNLFIFLRGVERNSAQIEEVMREVTQLEVEFHQSRGGERYNPSTRCVSTKIVGIARAILSDGYNACALGGIRPSK